MDIKSSPGYGEGVLQTTNPQGAAKAEVAGKSPDLNGSCRFESGPGHQLGHF